jgi:carbamoyltransferase
MAYAALGPAEPNAFPLSDEIVSSFPGIDPDNARTLGAKIASTWDELMPGMSDADIIATFQDYLGQRLLDRLTAVVEPSFPGESLNLVLGGGCALNIKCNTLIRSSGLFRDVFAPPFPNDAGAAIGTAVCEWRRPPAGGGRATSGRRACSTPIRRPGDGHPGPSPGG